MALVRSDDSEIVYQRSIGLRRVMGVFALLFAAMIAYLIPAMLPTAAYLHHRAPIEVLGRASFLIYALGGLLPVGVFLYAAGPDDLILDLKTWQYRFRRGFPGLARWQRGSFDDIECLYTKHYRTNHGDHYQILLGWKGTAGDNRFSPGDGDLAHRKDVLLGAATSMEDGLAQIQPIAARLGVPAEDGMQSARKARNVRAARRLQNRVIPLAFGGIALLNLLMSVPNLFVGSMLKTRGQTTWGTVVNRQNSSHRRRVDFRYIANGETYIVSDSVMSQSATTIDAGDKVFVTYLPDYPHTARIAQSNANREGSVFAGVAALMLVLGVLMPILSLLKDRREGGQV